MCYGAQDKDACWVLVQAVKIFWKFLNILGNISISRGAVLFWS